MAARSTTAAAIPRQHDHAHPASHPHDPDCASHLHDADPAGHAHHADETPQPAGRDYGNWPLVGLLGVIVLAVVLREPLSSWLDGPAVASGATIFVSLVVQALPFLTLGIIVSAAIAVFVPSSFFHRVLPRHPAAAVPVASVAGMALPGCECGSVPIAGGLVRRGVAPSVALTFLLAAPAINPIVLIATAVAFPGRPEMVIGRAVASALAAAIMGWLWLWLGRSEWIRLPQRPSVTGLSRTAALFATMRHDFVSAGGFLVIGAIAAALLKVVVPAEWLNVVADHPLLSIAALALLAVVLSLCSEADAFVAASLSQFSLTSRLTFLVVGPMIDLKLFAMQIGTFGRRFAFRFAPATLIVAVLVSTAVGWVLL